MIKKVNGCLCSIMGPDLAVHFVETWKAVSKFWTFKRYLYAKNDKGLHLNTEGSRRLRHFFEGHFNYRLILLFVISDYVEIIVNG